MAILAFLFSWPVVAAVVALSVTAGAMLMGVTPLMARELIGAKVLFSLGAVLLTVKFAIWLVSSVPARWDRVVGCVVVFGVIGIAWSESWLWINSRSLPPPPALAPAVPATPPPPATPHARSTEPPRPPALAPDARIELKWFEGESSVLQVTNKSRGPIKCKANGQILSAAPSHKRRDPYVGGWRDKYAPDGWITLQQNERGYVLVAGIGKSWGSDKWVNINGLSDTIESWNADWFKYADVSYELETQPELQRPISDGRRITYNRQQEVLELTELPEE